jgi:hypothetical protein
MWRHSHTNASATHAHAGSTHQYPCTTHGNQRAANGNHRPTHRYKASGPHGDYRRRSLAHPGAG